MVTEQNMERLTEVLSELSDESRSFMEDLLKTWYEHGLRVGDESGFTRGFHEGVATVKRAINQIVVSPTPSPGALAMNMPITQLGLSIQVQRRLMRYWDRRHIPEVDHTVGRAARLTDDELLDISGFGEKSRQELDEKLALAGHHRLRVS